MELIVFVIIMIILYKIFSGSKKPKCSKCGKTTNLTSNCPGGPGNSKEFLYNVYSCLNPECGHIEEVLVGNNYSGKKY